MGPENENDTKGLTLHYLLCVVDAWNLFKKSSLSIEVQNEFYVNLFEEIIDYTIDEVATRGTRTNPHQDNIGGDPLVRQDGTVRSGTGIYCMPTKKRRNVKGEVTNA